MATTPPTTYKKTNAEFDKDNKSKVSTENAVIRQEKAPSFEEILEELGGFGPYQVLVLCTYLLMEIAGAFVVFVPILAGRRVSRNCTAPPEPGDGNQSFIEFDGRPDMVNTSIITVSFRSVCDEFATVFESPFKYDSFVDEWDLVCDKAWIPDLFTSALMAGMILGNVVVSQISDWYGRRRVYLFVVTVMLFGTVMSGMSPNLYFYIVARFICGFSFCGLMNVACNSVMEFMTPKWRSLANCVGPMGEGIIMLSILGYFIRPWRMLYLATLSPFALFFVPIIILLPESPRWLLRNNRIKEAHSILCRMSKLNGTAPVKMATLEALRKQEEMKNESESELKHKISYIDFFKNKALLTKSLYLFCLWFSWNVGYYGISYNLRNVPGSPYYNLGLAGIANAIGQRLSMPLCDNLGRRRAVLAGMGLSATFLVTVAICFLALKEVSSTIILTGCFIGLMGLASTRASARLLSGETFPTAVRTMGLGFGGLGANIAGLLTPQVAYLGSSTPSIPFFIFAGVSVVGSLVVFMMKETNGSPLSDEIDLSSKGKAKKAVDLEGAV